MQSGLELHRDGRLAEAERAYQQVLENDPQHAGALHFLGLIAHQTGKSRIAAELIGKAVVHYPSNPQFLNNLGVVQLHLQRHEEALASFGRALSINPDYAEALKNRGDALRKLKRYQEALVSYEQAIVVNPCYAEAINDRGFVLHKLWRYDEAIASYDQALSINPDYPDALSNRGVALYQVGRYDAALACYEEALTLAPELPGAHWNGSVCRLVLGDFKRGWKEYEWRWKTELSAFERREFSQPLWLGEENISGKTILIHAEQGLGDTIQFARYARALAKRGAQVILEVQPALKSLLSAVEGAHRVLGRGEPLPSFDVQCPLLSLPLAFDTRMDTIPAPVAYLTVPDTALRKWETKLGPRKTPRIGIVWSGRKEHINDHDRSIALSTLVALASTGIQFVSLQNEVRPDDEKILLANKHIIRFDREFEDFSDTAALTMLMDLVISVDTSVAHLAGALGKPVWILLPFAPDWRWLLDREDSPWYPTARLFRQPRIGDWDSVVERVKEELTNHDFKLPR
jgi:tetratricopeptide (TPR) repeat protein